MERMLITCFEQHLHVQDHVGTEGARQPWVNVFYSCSYMPTRLTDNQAGKSGKVAP